MELLPKFKQIDDPKFWMFLILTASQVNLIQPSLQPSNFNLYQACLLNYCIFLCTRKNSAITTRCGGCMLGMQRDSREIMTMVMMTLMIIIIIVVVLLVVAISLELEAVEL